MTDERGRFQRVEAIFIAAAELDGDAREQLIRDRCGADETLAAEVRALLAQDDESSRGLDRPALGTPIALDDLPTTPVTTPASAPETIGGYRILRRIGAGGMGVVYEAEQDNPRRFVALKVINAGVASADALRRFEYEAQTLGRLQHPAIAQVFEAGTFDDGSGAQPYFAMEMIRGEPLTGYAEQHALGTRDRLDLIARICEGVQHAHGRGVIHRDLKPGNILVDDSGQPKILDFGVARATDGDVHTTTLRTDIGQLIGTVPYMSPEQAAGDPDDLDSRSDVYALGVLAYEFLAGRLPYDLSRKMIHEAVRVIQEEDPAPLSTVNRTLRGDVETIIGKALEKDKTRRYQSATELAADIRRHLDDEPIAARRPSTWYQLVKFTRRNRALVGGVAAVVVVLTAGVVVSTALALSERRARNDAVTSGNAAVAAGNAAVAAQGLAEDRRRLAERKVRTAAEVTAFLVDLFEVADRSTTAGRDVTAREMLDLGVARLRSELATEPEIRGALLDTMGRVYRSLGLYDEGAVLLEESLGIRRAVLGNDDPDVAETLFNLGELYHYAMNLDLTEKYYVEALDIRRRLLPPDHRDTARSVDLLGRMYRDRGDFERANELHLEALALRRRADPDDGAEISESEQSLGMVAAYQGNFAQAITHLRTALALRREAFGDEHASMPELLQALGAVLQWTGETAEAEKFHRESLAVTRKLFGDEHPYVAHGLNSLAGLEYSRGEYAAAEQSFRAALALLGDKHSLTTELVNNIAMAVQDQGRYEEAAVLFQDAIERYRTARGDDHPFVATAIMNLGGLRLEMGQLDEADLLVADALDRRRRALGATHANIGYALQLQGEVRIAQVRLDEAEALLLEASAIFAGAGFGSDHPIVKKNVRLLIDVFERLGRAEDAAAWRARRDGTSD